MTPEQLLDYLTSTDRVDAIETLRRHMLPADARERAMNALVAWRSPLNGMTLPLRERETIADAVLAALREGA